MFCILLLLRKPEAFDQLLLLASKWSLWYIYYLHQLPYSMIQVLVTNNHWAWKNKRKRKYNIFYLSIVIIIFICCWLILNKVKSSYEHWVPEVGTVVRRSKTSFVDVVASDHTKQFPGKLEFISNCNREIYPHFTCWITFLWSLRIILADLWGSSSGFCFDFLLLWSFYQIIIHELLPFDLKNLHKIWIFAKTWKIVAFFLGIRHGKDGVRFHQQLPFSSMSMTWQGAALTEMILQLLS